MWESKLETIIALGQHCIGQFEFESILSTLICDLSSENEILSDQAMKRLKQSNRSYPPWS